MNRLNLNPLLFILACGLGAWLLLTAAYSARSDFGLGVGELGSGPYVSGFWGDEAGAPRYRWTGSSKLDLGSQEPAVGLVNLPFAANPGANNRLRVTFRAGADRNSPLVTVSVNGQAVGQSQADPGAFKTVEYTIPSSAAGGDSTRVEISSEAFQPPTDRRKLGVQVAEVRLLTGPGLRRPPLDAVGWAWLYSLMVGLILLRVVGREGWLLLWSAGAGAISLVPWLLLPIAAPTGLVLWYTPLLLPLVAFIAAAAAFLVWRREASNGLISFLARLEKSPTLALNLLTAALVLYSLYALSVILRMDYIGHADYADNAVAARNIVRGQGYSLDYAAQFYQKYSLPRPADTWPPLQPLLIVPFYAAFGPTVWAAKLPNLLLVSALALAIFYYGTRLFNRRAALGAALLSLVAVVPAFSSAPAFFETVAYPINDLAFTLLAFLVLAQTALTLNDLRSKTLRPTLPEAAPVEVLQPQTAVLSPGAAGLAVGQPPAPGLIIGQPAAAALQPPAQTPPPPEISPQDVEELSPPAWSSFRPPPAILWLALWSGLLFLSKPSGALLLVVAGGWLVWHKLWGRRLAGLTWRSLLVGAGVALLLISPYLVRNVLAFGTPYRSTESVDAWITKWNPPDEMIYNLFKPFSAQETPGPRQLLEYGWDSNLNAVNNQFKKLLGHLWSGELYAPLLLVLAGVGLVVLPRRRYGLAALVGLAFGVYTLFFTVFWHYEPRYYLVWLPWIGLFGLYGLGWLYDRITSSRITSGGARPRDLGRWLLVGAFAVLLVPGGLALFESGPGYTSTTGIVTAANWIKDNTPPDAVVMSRNVWELSFHSNRKSVMTPNGADLNQIKSVMREYKASYLQLDHLEEDDRTLNRVWGQRRALWPLLDRKQTFGSFKKEDYDGFQLVYNKGGLLVYQWNGR